MTDSQKIAEWLRWIKTAEGTDYFAKAILAVYLTDGEKMLHAVLKAGKLEKTADVIKGMGK